MIRIELKRHTIENIDKLRVWLNDKDLNYYESIKPFNCLSEKDIMENLQSYIKNNSNEKNEFIHFAIHLKENNSFIGYCDIINIDYYNKNCELCLSIADKSYQNQGYGKEATNLLIDFCFSKLGMHKIKIGIFGFNFISMKLADYFGFTIEGILKEEVYKNGKYEDLIKYRLFNYEWDSNRGK